MKKLYAAYLVVFGLAAVIGTVVLVKKVNEVKANVAALEASTTQVETALTNAEAQVAQPAEAPKPASEPATQAQAGPVSTGIAAAHAQKPKPASKPAPLLPGAGASVDVGGAPSCADLGDLKPAVNKTPRGTPYKGQLLISDGTGRKLVPCTRARSFGNTVSPSFGKLQPGTYVHPTLGKFSVGRR